MKLSLKGKITVMIIVTLAMVGVYFHLISWRASMVQHYNMMPGGEVLVPLLVLFLLSYK